jgi:hypothetical protein
MRHPFITAQLLRQARTATAAELSAGYQRPGAASDQPGRDRAASPLGCGPRPLQDQGSTMSRLARGLVPGTMLVLSGHGLDQPIRRRRSKAPRWE